MMNHAVRAGVLATCAGLLSACGSVAPAQADTPAQQETTTGELSDLAIGQTPALYGVLQSQRRRLASDYSAGLRTRTLELAWDRFEPTAGQWNAEYIAAARSELRADVAAGFQVVLDLGVQYPPAWLSALPEARFINQRGQAYVSQGPGDTPVNAVFSRTVRDLQARYVQRVFGELGSNFMAVRLGWGHYGELGYPAVAPRTNSYWAYDDFAQGRRAGLPDGMKPVPLPGWRPAQPGSGAVSAQEQASARAFAEWYLNSLGNYHDWQVRLLRRMYSGRLFMLYPSFGLRPGQLDRAVAGGLRGETSPEINAELQRGFDFARFIARINDANVSPYTTWLDMRGGFVDDSSADTGMWSTAHYFAVLAQAHSPRLQVWGENTGGNSRDEMNLCAQRLHQYRLGGMFWAFNEDLYSGLHATIGDYARVMGR